MKTLITAFTVILFSSMSFAQTHVASHTIEMDTMYKSTSSKNTTKAASVSTLILEIYETSNFNYRTFLKNADASKAVYQINTETYTKKELTKIFRKGAKRNETVVEFEGYLNNMNPDFLKGISEKASVAVFNKFRKGTLHAYLDALPSDIL